MEKTPPPGTRLARAERTYVHRTLAKLELAPVAPDRCPPEFRRSAASYYIAVCIWNVTGLPHFVFSVLSSPPLRRVLPSHEL